MSQHSLNDSKNRGCASSGDPEKLHFVFVTIWYPSEENPSEGIFIKRHALSLVPHAKVSVIVPKSRPDLKSACQLNTVERSGLLECRAYYRRSKLPLVSFAINAFRFLKSCILALRNAESRRGEASVFFIHRLGVTAPFAAFVSFVLKKPFVAVEHFSGLAVQGTQEGFLEKSIYRFLSRRACRLITVSEFLKNRMIEKGINAKYEVVPNIVEAPKETENQKNAKTKTILYVGSFRKNKNVSLLIEAAGMLSRKRNDFRVIVVGDGEERDSIVSLTEKLGLNETVEFFGRLEPEEVLKLYGKSDVVVVTSFVETFSLAAAEAIAHGVPVITTPCGGPVEFVSKDNGIVLTSFSPGELADALESVLDGKVRFSPEKMKQYAEEHFSYEAVGRKLFKIACECLR